jgi:Ca-activated chloride channel family protein
MTRRLTSWAGVTLAAGLLAWAPTRAPAAGLLIADGGFGGVLEIKEHEVEVTLNNGIAVTRVTQIFHNTENRQVEALYTFPVPKGASVANFSMWINGKEMVGEVLEQERARQIYESYKVTRKDPGLLEQVDYRTFEMRIFPIAPNADQKVQLTYYQELDFDHDWATYVYPLATSTRKGLDSRTTGKFSIAMDVKSAIPIAAMESPSHAQDFVMAQHSDTYWQANLETTSGSLARDVVLATQFKRERTGMDLITSQAKGQDGFFALTLTAGEDLANSESDAMDYVFVLDVSGSMADDGKLMLSRDSIAAFLSELNEADRFEVITFNVQPTLAFSELRAGTPDVKEQAKAFLERREARGGTFLQPAIATAYKYADPDRRLNVVILSDGLTEQRERQTLLQLIGERPRNARVFCVGVGNDVNRPLLEQIATDAGGLAAFVSAGDNFSRQARLFRQKVTTPAASDVVIEIAGLEVFDVEPKVLPNLYHGTPVRVYGRYRGGGEGNVTLKATINGRPIEQTARLEFPKEEATNPEINRLWAMHRIDALLKDADRTGSRESVRGEVVRLGEAFSIVTEYTSFLVLENDAEYQRWKIDRRNLEAIRLDRSAQARRADQLEEIRRKAMADLGPGQPGRNAAESSSQQLASMPQPASAPAMSTPAPRPQTGGGQSFDLGIGTGPIGPLGLAFALWFARRARKQN